MKQKSKPTDKFAVCVNNTDYPASLEMHKIYRVLPDKDAVTDGDIRLIDESGEYYLYPAEYFVLVDFPQAVEKSLLQAARPPNQLQSVLTAVVFAMRDHSP